MKFCFTYQFFRKIFIILMFYNEGKVSFKKDIFISFNLEIKILQKYINKNSFFYFYLMKRAILL